MIMDFTKEVDEILVVLGIKHDDVSKEQSMELMGVLFKLLDKGIGFERNRVVDLVQRHAINPMAIVEKIRKPVR